MGEKSNTELSPRTAGALGTSITLSSQSGVSQSNGFSYLKYKYDILSKTRYQLIDFIW